MAAQYFRIDESQLDGLEGKVALITGASSGIGLATAKLFIRKRVQAVVLIDLHKPEETLPPQAIFIKADVTSWKQLATAFRVAVAEYGRIDIVHANAGIADATDYVHLEEDAGELLEPSRYPYDVNLFGCFNTVALAIHHMQRQEPPGGSIVMTSSGAGYEGVTSAAYTAGKHAIIGFLRAMRKQLHPKIPIRLNVVAPGFTQSSITAGALNTFKEAGLKVQPASAIGLAVGKLAVDPSYHGKSLFVANDECAEFEIPISEATARCVRLSNGTEEQFEKVLERMRALRLERVQTSLSRL